MASVFPFKAWHPHPDDVQELSCPPYDVISSDEARELAKGNDHSFLHVIRPEIDLPTGTAFNDEHVYTKGADNLKKLIDEGLLSQKTDPALYLYQLEQNNMTQTGVFGCVSVQEYDQDIILKHELTRPAKEDDRTKHILTQKAHAEPVMLTYKDHDALTQLQKTIKKQQEPLFHFNTGEVTHTVWEIEQEEPFKKAFNEVPTLYIADGHHRCKSASRAAHTLGNTNTKSDDFNYFPAVIFPASQMRILAYNRLIHDLPSNFLDKLNNQFKLTDNAAPAPNKKGTVSLYLDGSWIGLELPQKDNANTVETLDAYRLQHHLLQPLLDIQNPREDNNISFVGGSRGTEELERRVDAGDADLAISMYPTAIDELMDVSDEGALMPPKSTWFEPKLRSGLLVHTF